MSYPSLRMTNHPQGGMISVTVPIFHFQACHHTSGMAEVTVAKFCLQVET